MFRTEKPRFSGGFGESQEWVFRLGAVRGIRLPAKLLSEADAADASGRLRRLGEDPG